MRRAACAMAIVMTLCGCDSSPELPNDTNKIKTLTVEQAKALAQHEQYLHLNGLTTLSPEVAKALAQHRGYLYLNGLTTLSDGAATALAQHEGWLTLRGLTRLSESAAKMLQANRGIWLPDRFKAPAYSLPDEFKQ